MLCKILILKDKKVLSVHRDIRSVLKMRADQAARGEQVAQSTLSEADTVRECFFRNKKIINLLSEERCELDMQELRVECADRQGSPCMRYAASFSKDGTCRRSKYLINLRERRAGYPPNWTEEKEFFNKIV